MASGPGKVSFSFSKFSIKKPSLNVQPKETVKKVDKIEFIDSIEDNSVNVINADDCEVKKPLVIPLEHPNLLLQSMIDAVNSRKEKGVEKDTLDSDEAKEANGVESDKCEAKLETLEEMAARELVEDATQQMNKKPASNNLTVPLTKDPNANVESNLDDYENIPIADFGLAMLRGMGWDPKKGIGKNGKVVKVTGPTVRPKGLGLGADKAIATQKPTGKNVGEKEVLTKGSKVRITLGQYKNLYGTVEGFHDDGGRIDVHMAISNERLSMNECFVQLVTPEEFGKYSKVININAFNNYKEREESQTSDSRDIDVSESRVSSRREVSPNPATKKNSKENRHNSHSSSSSRRELSPDSGSKRDSRENRHNSHSSSSGRRKVSPDSVSRKHSKESRHDSYSSKSKKNKKYNSDSDDDVKRYKEKYSSKSRRRDSSSESDDYSQRSRSGRDSSSRSDRSRDGHKRDRSRRDKHSK